MRSLFCAQKTTVKDLKKSHLTNRSRIDCPSTGTYEVLAVCQTDTVLDAKDLGAHRLLYRYYTGNQGYCVA